MELWAQLTAAGSIMSGSTTKILSAADRKTRERRLVAEISASSQRIREIRREYGEVVFELMRGGNTAAAQEALSPYLARATREEATIAENRILQRELRRGISSKAVSGEQFKPELGWVMAEVYDKVRSAIGTDGTRDEAAAFDMILRCEELTAGQNLQLERLCDAISNAGQESFLREDFEAVVTKWHAQEAILTMQRSKEEKQMWGALATMMGKGQKMRTALHNWRTAAAEATAQEAMIARALQSMQTPPLEAPPGGTTMPGESGSLEVGVCREEQDRLPPSAASCDVLGSGATYSYAPPVDVLDMDAPVGSFERPRARTEGTISSDVSRVDSDESMRFRSSLKKAAEEEKTAIERARAVTLANTAKKAALEAKLLKLQQDGH